MRSLRSPQVQDAALAAALAVAGQASIWSGQTREGPKWATVTAALLMTVPLAWRRRRPISATVCVATAWVFQAVAAESPEAIWALPVVFLVAYGAGSYLERREAVAVGLLVLAAIWTSVLLDPNAATGDKVVTAPLFVGLPWAIGRVVRGHRRQAEALAELARQLELEREERARTAVELERARLARELHDVVAHAVSVVVLQAEAGDSLFDSDPVRSRDAFRSIESTGRQALAEMRRMLGLLKTSQLGELAPQPGLAQLDALVDEVRAAGLPVVLEWQTVPGDLAPGLDLAAYRIVQEALTNALKHAGTVPTRVRVRGAGDALEVEVVDAGGPGNGNGLGSGQGLVGMRERAALYGGTLEVGPRPQGGFRVHARFPLRGHAA